MWRENKRNETNKNKSYPAVSIDSKIAYLFRFRFRFQRHNKGTFLIKWIRTHTFWTVPRLLYCDKWLNPSSLWIQWLHISLDAWPGLAKRSASAGFSSLKSITAVAALLSHKPSLLLDYSHINNQLLTATDSTAKINMFEVIFRLLVLFRSHLKHLLYIVLIYKILLLLLLQLIHFLIVYTQLKTGLLNCKYFTELSKHCT